MRSIPLPLLPAFVLMCPWSAMGGAPERVEFEMWEDAERAAAPSPTIAKAPGAGRITNPAVPPEQVREEKKEIKKEKKVDDEFRHLIQFGAGASYLIPYRFADGATGGEVLPEFSVSVAPFGRFMEIGADLAMRQQSTLLFRPNLKFYSFEYEAVSLYLEVAGAVYSHKDGTDFGGGGGAGLIIRLMDHLTLEVHASAVVVDLSSAASEELFGPPAASHGDVLGLDGLTVFPSMGARVMARF